MPRTARIKDPTAVYHIMSRSISEFDLFPDDSDKDCFLDLLQKYKEKFHSKIYGYCLMSNHYHLLIDTCGFDISKFMKCLNQTYVKYINRKYNRRGHLLADRFNSKIVNSDEYILTVSAYIHNNSKDLPGYAGREFDYPYSSMAIYLGKQKDKRCLINTDFVLGCVNETDKGKALKAYMNMVIERREIGINVKLRKYLEDFQKEQYEYRSYREVLLREKNPDEVIKRIAEKYGINNDYEVMHKWKRSSMKFRGIVAYSLATLCGMNYKEICKKMNNITLSCCATLINRGFEALRKEDNKDFLIELCIA